MVVEEVFFVRGRRSHASNSSYRHWGARVEYRMVCGWVDWLVGLLFV